MSGVLDWYATHARDLPWRRPEATPWGVLVSELMLQQTPVARVLEPWAAWMERWPTPAALAAEPSGAAVAAWGRLGYPRRALRLHQAATVITERHDGEVPDSYEDLLALPGIGDYTAATVASFAYKKRHVVLDTNVRRVLARIDAGVAFPAPTPTAAERAAAARYLPDEPATAARWAVASMELGALVCTARTPGCDQCPVADLCRWREAGYPAYDGPPRRGQAWHGTDRQCRGVLLGAVRDFGPLPREDLLARWPDRRQAETCLDSLIADGLLHGDDMTSL